MMLFRSCTWSHQQLLHSRHRGRERDAADKGDVYPEETAEEPFVEDEPCHLQQGDDGELDGVGLPQDGSNGNEGRGRAHLCYHETVYGSVTPCMHVKHGKFKRSTTHLLKLMLTFPL